MRLVKAAVLVVVLAMAPVTVWAEAKQAPATQPTACNKDAKCADKAMTCCDKAASCDKNAAKCEKAASCDKDPRQVRKGCWLQG